MSKRNWNYGLPDLEALKKELKRERYKRRFRRLLRSTTNALVVVAAIAALIATLVLPVLQIAGTSMEPSTAQRHGSNRDRLPERSAARISGRLQYSR